MAPRLRQHALARVDQHDGEVGVRCAGRHVARVLLVARRIGHDELALVGRKEAVGDIDGDALLALGGEPVHQQREVDALVADRAVLALLAQRGELVVEDELAVIEQPADQRRLAVIDAAAGQEAQQALVGLLGEPQSRDRCRRCEWARRRSSEIALLLLLLHRADAVAVDQPALALRGARRPAFP